jgi:hypothetical protein
MYQVPHPEAFSGQVVQVSLQDRWQVYRRLQELEISCWCPSDGSLRVEVTNYLQALLVRSIVFGFVASRDQLIDWLEDCWKVQVR